MGEAGEIIIETNRLYIRKLLLDDVEQLFKYSQEEVTRRELPDEVYENMENAKETIGYFISNYESENPLTGKKGIGTCYGIILKTTEIIIGHIGLINIKRGVEIEYAIGTNYQNNGYATEVINPFMEWAKKEFSIDKIYGIVKQENAASWKVLEKNGFKLEEEGLHDSFGGKHYIKIYAK